MVRRPVGGGDGCGGAAWTAGGVFAAPLILRRMAEGGDPVGHRPAVPHTDEESHPGRQRADGGPPGGRDTDPRVRSRKTSGNK